MSTSNVPSTLSPELPEMTLIDHLRELRKRLINSLIAVFLGSCVAYFYTPQIFDLLTASFHHGFGDATLIGTGPAEAFILKFQVAIFAGILLASPIVFYQGWLFVEPGLYEREKRLALPFVLATTLLFLGGVTFCYKAVVPFALSYLRSEYASIHVTPTIRITEHLSALMKALIGFGAVFEMPMVAFFLGRIGLIDHKMMIGSIRYAVIAIFILAAIFSPPDVISQLLMVGPLILLYGISILIVKLTAQKPLSPTSPSNP